MRNRNEQIKYVPRVVIMARRKGRAAAEGKKKLYKEKRRTRTHAIVGRAYLGILGDPLTALFVPLCRRAYIPTCCGAPAAAVFFALISRSEENRAHSLAVRAYDITLSWCVRSSVAFAASPYRVIFRKRNVFHACPKPVARVRRPPENRPSFPTRRATQVTTCCRRHFDIPLPPA